jgi:transposase-like protein
MKKDKLNLPPDFFNQFKTASDLEDFFRDLYKEGVHQMLKAEIDDHLGYEKHSPKGINSGNSRNGTSKKTLKRSVGDVPRDRNSDFNPIIVPKHKTISEKIEQAIVGMYSRGMATRDIEEQIREIYGVEVSETTISNLTGKMIEAIKAWQNRPLESVYYVVWMDGISFKIRYNSKITNKTIFLVLGVNKKGMKEVLGMWINKTENTSFWLQVLIDLKARGVAGYPYAVKSWQANWELLTSYFDFPLEIRTIIDTTNPIESLNSSIRKYTKSKTIFPDDQAALKATYFSILNIQKKWSQPIRNWGIILNQFLTIFEERCRI